MIILITILQLLEIVLIILLFSEVKDLRKAQSRLRRKLIKKKKQNLPVPETVIKDLSFVDLDEQRDIADAATRRIQLSPRDYKFYYEDML